MATLARHDIESGMKNPDDIFLPYAEGLLTNRKKQKKSPDPSALPFFALSFQTPKRVAIADVSGYVAGTLSISL